MKKVFYCPSCGYVGAAEEGEASLCPQCLKALYSTGMDRDAYLALSEAEKSEAFARWNAAPAPVPASPTALAGERAGKNRVAAFLKVIAICVYALLGLIGLIFLVTDEAAIGLILLLSGLLTGTMFLGFSEIIRLLDLISKKQGPV